MIGSLQGVVGWFLRLWFSLRSRCCWVLELGSGYWLPWCLTLGACFFSIMLPANTHFESYSSWRKNPQILRSIKSLQENPECECFLMKDFEPEHISHILSTLEIDTHITNLGFEVDKKATLNMGSYSVATPDKPTKESTRTLVWILRSWQLSTNTLCFPSNYSRNKNGVLKKAQLSPLTGIFWRVTQKHIG